MRVRPVPPARAYKKANSYQSPRHLYRVPYTLVGVSTATMQAPRLRPRASSDAETPSAKRGKQCSDTNLLEHLLEETTALADELRTQLKDSEKDKTDALTKLRVAEDRGKAAERELKSASLKASAAAQKLDAEKSDLQEELRLAQRRLDQAASRLNSIKPLGNAFLKAVEQWTGQPAVAADECLLCMGESMDLMVDFGRKMERFECWSCGFVHKMCDGCRAEWAARGSGCMSTSCDASVLAHHRAQTGSPAYSPNSPPYIPPDSPDSFNNQVFD